MNETNLTWRIIPYTAGNPAWNMAVDEAIFSSYQANLSQPTVRFYGWDPPTLSIGYFQHVERDVNLSQVYQKGLGFVRRNTGGRAVLHHHELTYSVVAGTKDGLPDSLLESYLFISKALTTAIHEFGINAEIHQGLSSKLSLSGACFDTPSWYEITVDRKKLIGSAQLRQQGSVLQHGSILMNFEAEHLASILNISESEQDHFIDKLTQKVTSLHHLGVKCTIAELSEAILESFSKLYQIKFEVGALNQEELELVDELIHEKYATDSWNLRRGQRQQQMTLKPIKKIN